MLKGKKSSEETVQSSNRTKLPLESGIRALSGIKELLAAAEASRGKQIELEWTTGNAGQSFVLDCQWDPSSEDPVWSLYEENDSGSKRLWNQPFAAADIEMFYDVLVMSCGSVTHSEKLSDILKPKTPPDKEEQSKPAGNEALSKEKKPQPDINTDFSLNINQTTAPAAQPIPNQPNTSFPATTLSPPSYNMPPGGFPIAYPPMMAPGQGYITPPVMPPPGWTFAPLTPAPPVPAARSVSEQLSSLPIDTSLVNKRYEISWADLLKEAELINRTTLAAALKMQGLVEEGRVPVEEAVKLLKQHHQKGDAIDTCIGSAGAVQGKTKDTGAGSTGKIKPLSKEATAAFELLEKAGLLSNDDITTAKNVSRKHGGDLISILKAAQKLDDKTFEAALICVSLLGKELMKIEQCVITLNYCSRSRVGFDEALADLNWDNPRKK